MAHPAALRYRIIFDKTESMRFTSHLDLHRTWERTFRRAGLPLAYSEGFHPHPRINIGAALPLGCLSQGDLVDVWLEQELTPAEIEAALQPAAPPGIRLQRVTPIGSSDPALQRQIEAAIYEVVSSQFPDPAEMTERIARLLASDRLPRSRRGKLYDLRPLIESLEFDVPVRTLRMRLSAREGSVGRPEEVLEALGFEGHPALAVRTQLILEPSIENPRPA